MHVLSKLNCFNLRLDLGNFSWKEMHYDNVKCLQNREWGLGSLAEEIVVLFFVL